MKTVNENFVLIKASRIDNGVRLDKWLLKHFPNLNNGFAQKMIRKALVKVDGKKVDFNYRLIENQQIKVPITLIEAIPSNNNIKQDLINLNLGVYKKTIDSIQANLLYKDDDFLVINKPYNLAVQGGSNITFNLTHVLPFLKFESNEAPVLVHRIDKDTSGLLILARNVISARYMFDKFKNKEVNKQYLCVVDGILANKVGTINAPLLKTGESPNQKMVIDSLGKESITHYKVLAESSGASLVEASPVTGRTHQIRVHFARGLNAPILGDFKYGYKKNENIKVSRLYLHAKHINFTSFNNKVIDVNCELDQAFQDLLTFLQL
jgi:23S rRNA pseudouridine955/2504/2580 synthase